MSHRKKPEDPRGLFRVNGIVVHPAEHVAPPDPAKGHRGYLWLNDREVLAHPDAAEAVKALLASRTPEENRAEARDKGSP